MMRCWEPWFDYLLGILPVVPPGVTSFALLDFGFSIGYRIEQYGDGMNAWSQADDRINRIHYSCLLPHQIRDCYDPYHPD